MADKIKLVLAVLITAAGIYGFYHFAEQGLLYRVLGLLVVIAISAFVALQTRMGADTLSFGRLAVLEVRKAVWPTRQETVQTTLIVMAMVVVAGLVLWLFDTFLLWAVKFLTGQGG